MYRSDVTKRDLPRRVRLTGFLDHQWRVLNRDGLRRVGMVYGPGKELLELTWNRVAKLSRITALKDGWIRQF